MTVLLPDLFEHIPVTVLSPARLPHVAITGIVFDSRQVQPGNLFVALIGGSSDGHRYLAAAAERGAAAAVGMLPLGNPPLPYIQVEETRRALAYLAAAYHGFPAHHLTVIGVTGTDGKTTTSSLMYRILTAAGLKAGMISTVNALIGEQALDTGFHVTTPEATDVQRYLAQMVSAGLTHVVLESTSHGLAQQRVTACEFDIGVVTNITHEHLDYHGTYAAYREAKASLFRELAQTPAKPGGNPRLAVLNRDDASYAYLREAARVRQVAYSVLPSGDVLCGGDIPPAGDIWADQTAYSQNGMSFRVHTRDGVNQPVQTRLVGDFNVSNCLAAFSAAVFGLGIDPHVAAAGIASLEGVPGRMEMISLGQDFTAVVDFAHTPNALLRTLQTARQMTSGRVIAVFGSAGLRDRAKRRMMAAVSIQNADISILTAEDPRTESLDAILAEMAGEAAANDGVEGQTFHRVPDRGEAIRLAVRLAHPGDLVIACGKGHEQSMCFVTTEYPWDDRTALRAALSERLGIIGPQMPYLPTQDQS